MEEKSIKLVTKECPNCGFKLNVPIDSNEPVLCPSCDQSAVPVATISQRKFDNLESQKSGRISADKLDRISTIAAAESFFDSFLATYEWDEFIYKYDLLMLPELGTVLNNLKISASNDPNVWKLEIQTRILLINKKISYLDQLATDLVKTFNEDETEGYRLYDSYRSAANYLVDHQNSIIAKLNALLEQYWKYAPKIGAPLENEIKHLQKSLAALGRIEQMTDIRQFLENSELNDARIRKALINIGLDAEELYQSAVELYANNRVNEALVKFLKIRGYKDSDVYYQKANHFYFANYYMEIGKDTYFISNEKLYTLAEYDDKIKNDKHFLTTIKTTDGDLLVSGINVIIGHFGSKIFYFDEKQKVQVYDFHQRKGHEVSASSRYYLGNNFNKYYYNADKTKVFLLRRLNDIYISAPNAKEQTKNKNNFSLVSINFTVTSDYEQTIVPELVDIYGFKNNVVFYEFYATEITTEPVGKRGNKTIQIVNQTEQFVAYDIVNSAKSTTFSKYEPLITIYDDKLVYLRYNKTMFNMSLCVREIFDSNAPEIIIDPNVYNYEFMTSKAIYYSIGNNAIKALYRYDLASGHIEEAISRFRTTDYSVIGDYLYYFTGDEFNLILKKYGLITKKTILLSANIKKLYDIVDGYFYYSSNNNDLWSVRIDGTDRNYLAEDVTNFIGVFNNRVYYVRSEYAGEEIAKRSSFDEKKNESVTDRKIPKIGYSLYSCSAQGNDLKKLAFDTHFVGVKNSEKRNLLVVYKENRNFKCITEGAPHQGIFSQEIFTYMDLDLQSGVFTTRFVANYPQGKALIEDKRRGCFRFFRKKPTEVELEYEELPNRERFSRTDIVAAGYNSQSN